MYTVVPHVPYIVVYCALTLRRTLGNLVYVLVQSSTRLENHIKIQIQRRGVFILLRRGNWKCFFFIFYHIAFDQRTYYQFGWFCIRAQNIVSQLSSYRFFLQILLFCVAILRGTSLAKFDHHHHHDENGWTRGNNGQSQFRIVSSGQGGIRRDGGQLFDRRRRRRMSKVKSNKSQTTCCHKPRRGGRTGCFLLPDSSTRPRCIWGN